MTGTFDVTLLGHSCNSVLCCFSYYLEFLFYITLATKMKNCAKSNFDTHLGQCSGHQHKKITTP